MAEPKQKSIDLPLYLTRYTSAWQSPQWMEAERWRRVVKNQPVSMVCQESIINDIKATGWEIKAKLPKDEDKYAGDIEAYTEILNVQLGDAIQGFDPWMDKATQDLLTVPFGGVSEVIRYPDGMGPFSTPHPRGHVYAISYIDPATCFVTYDKEFPIAQRLKEDVKNVVYFRESEVMRFVMSPRTEIQRRGYGMPPPEKIYLAIEMLYRGDSYYANLLLDTPEAGLLDLGDMSYDTAKQWLQSFRELFTGIDPFKIPVLYEHTTPAQFINFGRPPSEMSYNDTTLKYSAVVHAGYGLTLTDTSLGDPQKTLAGSIRDERRSRRSGYTATKEIIKNAINNNVLPDYLEFVWIDSDEEAKAQRGRSFMMAANALKTSKEAGFITAEEGQAQLLRDGHITVEVEPPEESPMLPAQNGNGASAPSSSSGRSNLQDELDKVPATEGGRGDIVGTQAQKAALLEDDSVYRDTARLMESQLDSILDRATRPRLMKLIKVAVRQMFPDVNKALVALSNAELVPWREERLKLWFGESSVFDEFPDVIKASQELLDDLDDALDKESWWTLDNSILAAILGATVAAYSDGASLAAALVWEFLYTEGLRDTSEIPGFSFDLVNPETLRELEEAAADLVRNVDKGTKFYLKRMITAGVDEGLSSPEIARRIKDGAMLDEILRSADFAEGVIERVKTELGAMSESRANSITNTEINRAESEGRRGQWKAMGLTKKAWAHTGPDSPCPEICQPNIDRGFIGIDDEFENVFGPTQTPPGHPAVCHCHLEFSEEELLSKSGNLEIWNGE